MAADPLGLVARTRSQQQAKWGQRTPGGRGPVVGSQASRRAPRTCGRDLGPAAGRAGPADGTSIQDTGMSAEPPGLVDGTWAVAPAWTAREVLDLIAVWGEDSMLTELRSKRRNEKTFEKISKAMMQRGHTRDSVQCRVKVKNSGAGPKTCHFYAELNAILGGSANTTPPLSVDSELGVLISAMAEDSADREDEEEEEEDEVADST
uniref:Myb/SANT-like DNA-binding domain-containing protein n=1 Tax=Gopherus agassizii TaxID=38772 RepID=A0A452HHV8_9SAUR